LVSEAVVNGDRRKYLTALVKIDEEPLQKFISDRRLADAPADQIPEIRKEIQTVVDEVNSHLARVETIKKFTILHRNFTIEDGELTPTLKVKRKKVNEHFADQIEAMYSD